ncbi:MAG: polysaccharide deacetylase family protein [Candidatus Saganbacteria bacterium]|nr:polysaccharide deacetylase family protein [Candidatus Saganbacteria bacterium]
MPVFLKNRIIILSSVLIFSAALIAVSGCKVTVKKAGGAIKKNQNYVKIAEKEIDKSFFKIYVQNEQELLRGVKYHKLINGDPFLKEIALTFDDGPHPHFTMKLLEILKKNNIKATFFLVGKKAVQYPRLVREEMASGHSVGNHTYSHLNLTLIPSEDAAVEIKACGLALMNITGQYPHLFRPPGGDYDTETIRVAEQLGYTTVLWTANTGDAANIGKRAIKIRLFNRIDNGGIILMHDGIQATIDILPQVIGELKKEGYDFVTIDEMIAHKNLKGAVRHGLLYMIRENILKILRLK